MTIPDDQFDIHGLCELAGQPGGACRAGALVQGNVAVAGLLMTLLLLAGVAGAGGKARTLRLRPGVSAMLACGVSTLVAAHLIVRMTPPFFASRIDALGHESLWVSSENLLWPLLLQLHVSAQERDDRIVFGVLAVMIAALSPYRGVLVAVALFGILIPLAGQALRSARRERGKAVAAASVFSVVCVAVAAIVVQDTGSRASHLAGEGAGVHSVPGIADKFSQRISFPLYQASFAEATAQWRELPGMKEEFARKFHVSDAPNLGEYLYDRMYGSGSVGQMTVSYVGEAHAVTSGPPLGWAAAAPLMLVLAWLGLRRFGIEAGVLVGIAIWRGAIGGLGSVLPALLVQLAALVALAAVAPRTGSGRAPCA